MVTHKTTLALDDDRPPNAAYRKIKMRQTDSGRMLQVAITSGGLGFNIPTGAIIEFNARNPMGQIVTRTEGVSHSGSTIVVHITPNVLAVNGDVACEFVITDQSGEQVGTCNFIIEVWGAVLTSGEIVELPDYQAVQSARVAAEQAAGQAEGSAVDAAGSATAAATSATAAAGSAATAESAKDGAEAAAGTYPYIGDNLHWFVFDIGAGGFVDTGLKAPGDNGITAPIDGFYTMYIDEAGHLIVLYDDAADPPPFEIGEDGHLYYVFEEAG